MQSRFIFALVFFLLGVDVARAQTPWSISVCSDAACTVCATASVPEFDASNASCGILSPSTGPILSTLWFNGTLYDEGYIIAGWNDTICGYVSSSSNHPYAFGDNITLNTCSAATGGFYSNLWTGVWFMIGAQIVPSTVSPTVAASPISASVSPSPISGLTPSQMAGLGWGIGVPLVLMVILVFFCACWALQSNRSSAQTHLLVFTAADANAGAKAPQSS